MWFEVSDTGPGIPADRIQAIFEPFTQVDTSTTRTHGGSGLGLTISRHLCRLMGGEIEVTSEPGRGSTFRLHLPIERVAMDPAQSCTAAGSADAAPYIRPGIRILLVEDGPDNQRLVRLILERAGAAVALAENGAEGVEAMQAALHTGAPFDLVLMDMQMPVMDGYEATRRIREMGYTGPILALTAHAMSDDRARSLAAGCNEYLVKPIQRDDLIVAVARFTAEAKPLSSE
jgi:CheY-like chemotaxis protein